MSFVAREANRIEGALLTEPEGPRHNEMRAALQALKWTTEPQGFAAPLSVILGSESLPPTGTPVATADCLAAGHPAP
jgi:hypothetical protein